MKPTVLDGIVTFAVLFGIAVFASKWTAGRFVAMGFLTTVILALLIRNAGDVQNPKPGTLAYLEANTLRKLGKTA